MPGAIHSWWSTVCHCTYVFNMLLLDIDECTTGVHNCIQNQQCVNRPGNYVCECLIGYELLNGTCEGM